MNKLLPYILIVVIIIVIAGVFVLQKNVGDKTGEQISQSLQQENNKAKENTMPFEGKKIAMIIAWKNYRDAEYFVTKENLEKSGAQITTVSTKLGAALGADGGEAQVQIVLSDLNVADFDAVVFIGGPGALQYLDNQISYNIAKETLSQGKTLAAICIAPTILAKAGLLKGKNATVWSSSLDGSAVKTLEANGAVYQNSAVVVDNNIVTANGPEAAEQFAKAIIESFK